MKMGLWHLAESLFISFCSLRDHSVNTDGQKDMARSTRLNI